MLINYKTKRVPTIILLLSLLVALYVDVKPVNWSLVYGGFASEGLMNILYPIIAFLIVILSILFTNMMKSINPTVIFLSIYIFLFYYISNITIGPPETEFTMILTFVFVSLLIPSFAIIDVRILLRGTMIFPIFAIFKLDTVFATTKDWTDFVSMDVSYGFLIPIAAAIIYSFLYLHDDRWIVRTLMLVIVAVNAVFFALLFVRGSRGPLLSVILLILFLYSVKHKTNGYGVSYSKGKMGTFLFVLFFLLLGYVFFVEVIVDILATMGIKSYAFTKIIELENEGDISNGRSLLNYITLKGIIEHPILGNGFDRFNANTNLLYPHNFILQILYDGGILFFFVLMTPIIRSTIQRYKSCAYDEYALLTFLMFSSVPGALFSHNLYTNGMLWLFFGSVLSKQFVYNKNRTM